MRRSSSLPCNVRVVISTTELAGTKRSGLGIHGCRQRPAKVACVQAYIAPWPTISPRPRPRAGAGGSRTRYRLRRWW
jgi:hypothetical protein